MNKIVRLEKEKKKRHTINKKNRNDEEERSH